MMVFRSIFKSLRLFWSSVDEIITRRRNLRRIAKYKSVPFIKGNTKLHEETYLGRNCHFNGLKVVGGGKLIIGDNFHSGEEILVITQNHRYDGGESIPYDKTYEFKDVVIEDNVWIGSRVVILGGVTIGEGAVVQAGSVVVTDIPKYAIAGGHPAKQFASRDVDLYEKLKRQKKFH
jgi:acetyltransferase-like isoleucine patch superfamily enzyme